MSWKDDRGVYKVKWTNKTNNRKKKGSLNLTYS